MCLMIKILNLMSRFTGLMLSDQGDMTIMEKNSVRLDISWVHSILGRKSLFYPVLDGKDSVPNIIGQSFREIISAWQNLDPVELKDLEIERRNEFWLPMVHLQYNPIDWLKVRLARTETISRPNYNYYAPITHINGYDTQVRTANSQIRPSHAINYDLSISVYENKVGLLTVSPFYKIIKDNIIPVSFKLDPDIVNEVPKGLNIPITWYEQRPEVSSFINNPHNATYKGIEFSWTTNFWYLPSILKRIGFEHKLYLHRIIY